jgi:hypothetical protein
MNTNDRNEGRDKPTFSSLMYMKPLLALSKNLPHHISFLLSCLLPYPMSTAGMKAEIRLICIALRADRRAILPAPQQVVWPGRSTVLSGDRDILSV